MGGQRRVRRLSVLFGLAALAAACASAPPATLSPAPTSGDPTPQPDGTRSTAIDTQPCRLAEARSAELRAYEDPPQRPDVPGAQPTPPIVLNPGRKPPTPDDPDGVVVTDDDLGPTVLLPPGAHDPDAEDPVVLFQQPLTIRGAPASEIAEPEVAVSGESMLITWNWGAAQSFDGGRTASYLNPHLEMTPADDGFCCDQLAEHVPSHDLWIWVLQYLRVETPGGNNRIRLAAARGDAAFAARQFDYWDVTAQQAGFGDGIWLDQPKLGVTERHLYLSINAFHPKEPHGDGQFVAALVMRLPLAELAAGSELQPVCFTTTDQLDAWGQPLFGPYPVRRAADTMYLASHFSRSTLAVWRWPDDAAAPTLQQVSDADEAGRPKSYPRAPLYSCQREGSNNPVMSDWCTRSDDRLHSGWLHGGELGFAWNVSQDASTGKPFPFVWVLILSEERLSSCAAGQCVLAYPHIWHSQTAFQYGTVAPNSRGDLGAVAVWGGGRSYMGCAVLVRDRATPPERGWDLASVAASDTDSRRPASGDYLGITSAGGNDSWTASCMTLSAAGGDNYAEIHAASFGRRSDQPVR